jgi:VanZ family protein
MKYITLIFRFWKTILILIIIYLLCLIPAHDIGEIDIFKIPHEDSVVHVMMFLGFSAMLFIDLKRNTYLANNMLSLSFTVVVVCILLGITTELLQLFLASLQRTGSITDFMFDMTGTALGITGMRLIKL